jgi:hypothetical protein
MSNTKTAETQIRRDIFAVKVFEDVGETDGAWVFVGMFRSLESAKRWMNNCFVSLGERYFPSVSPKIVHPSQFVVSCFVAAGNRIDD